MIAQSEITNEQLVARYQSGDHAARQELITRNMGLVWRVVRKTVHPAEADDVAQECVFALVDAADKYDPSKGAAFSTWATWRIRGRVVDMARRRERFVARQHRAFELRDDDEAVEYDHVAAMVREDERRQLASMLLQLPKRERRVVWSWACGVLGTRLGDKYGISASRAEQLRRRALDCMRNMARAV